jgi:hypothetical protein
LAFGRIRVRQEGLSMPRAASTKREAPKTIADIDRAIEDAAKRLGELHGGMAYYVLLQTPTHANITGDLVDDVYEDLRTRFGSTGQALLVVVASEGGDIDAAYNLSRIFRRYGTERLVFVIPRWAKSAATLLVCSGDEILMTPVAELGPLDPQITVTNPMDRRMEHFSPLHIKSTLELINSEYKEGHRELANALIERLQFPLTLGSFQKTLDIGKEYLRKLLPRMIPGDERAVAAIAERLVEGYADHGACIACEELQDLGLKATELDGEELDLAWEIHRLGDRKHELIVEQRRKEMEKKLKDLPPGLLDALGDPGLFGNKSHPNGGTAT